MKKRFLLPGLLLVIVAFVLLEIVTAGDSHIVVVEDNAALASENGKLKTENKQLKSENTKLALLNEQLTADLTRTDVIEPEVLAASAPPRASAAPKAIVEPTASDKLPKIIVSIESEVEEGLGWCTPDIAYEMLQEKLGNIPTREEYKQTLLDLLKRNMLFHPGDPDPYVQGDKVTKLEINKLIK